MKGGRRRRREEGPGGKHIHRLRPRWWRLDLSHRSLRSIRHDDGGIHRRRAAGVEAGSCSFGRAIGRSHLVGGMSVEEGDSRFVVAGTGLRVLEGNNRPGF